MRFKLICDENIKNMLKELLVLKNIDFDEKSDRVLLQKGFDYQGDYNLKIEFDIDNISLLLELISSNEAIDQASDFLTCRFGEKFEVIKYDEIAFIESDGNNLNVIKASGQTYRKKGKMYEMEKKLFPYGFVRVSKSYLVNIKTIKEISPIFNGRLLLKFENIKTGVEVSKSFVKKFKAYLEF